MHPQEYPEETEVSMSVELDCRTPMGLEPLVPMGIDCRTRMDIALLRCAFKDTQHTEEGKLKKTVSVVAVPWLSPLCSCHKDDKELNLQFAKPSSPRLDLQHNNTWIMLVYWTQTATRHINRTPAAEHNSLQDHRAHHDHGDDPFYTHLRESTRCTDNQRSAPQLWHNKKTEPVMKNQYE